MAEKSYRDWQVPPQAVTENTKLGWLNEQAQDGIAWNRSQRGWNDHHKSFEILAGKIDLSKIPAYRSGISTARLKRNIRQVRGAVTNIRPISGFTSNNPAFNANASMMNEVTTAIYQEQFLDLSLRNAFDWAAACNTGWIHPVYRRDFAGRGKGSLNLDTYGQPCILPTQMPSSGDIQRAYAVTLLDEMPIYMAHGLFPKFQDRLHPTSSQVWYASEIRTAARGNLLQRMFGSWLKPSGGDNTMSDAYVPVRKTWVIDLSLNETGKPVFMGDWRGDPEKDPYPTSSWSYRVPYMKEQLPDGKIADENDCRMYPYRRLIISSETCIMYDGPAFDWHTELPLVPLCLDDWAFDPAGFSLARDGYDIQMSLNELERGTMDKNRAQMDMALAYDINSVSSKEANQFDPMQPRARVGFDGSMVSAPFTSPVPPEVLKVSAEIFQAINHLEQTMDYQMGVNDIASMARARGLVNSEGAMEKLLEASGPIVMDITRSIERTITKVGRQVKFIIPQYYTVREIMTYTGADKISQQTFDYDPEKLIPSHMMHEKATNEDGTVDKSKYSLQQRAKWFAENLKYIVAPHTAHEITQMATKLGLVQLRKSGIQISSKTIAAAWNITDFGGPTADTEYDRYMAEQDDVAKRAIQLKQLVDSITQAGVQAPPVMGNALAELTGGQTQEGRPPTGTTAPQLVQKDGGMRTAVSQTGS